MKDIEYSIVIPTYNEASQITASLNQILSFMREFSESFEIIVSDDGSLDTTAQLVSELQKDNKEIVLINNPHKGKSHGLYAGVNIAKGEYIYLCDTDLSSPINELKKLSVWLKDQDYDIAIASREGTGSLRIGEPFYRHFVGRVFNIWVQLIALPGIEDSQCGFKLLKGDVARDIFSRLVVYGWDGKELTKPFFGALDVEILFIARRLGYRIKEVPVTWTYVSTSRFNFVGNTYMMARDVLKIRINGLTGKYSL